MFSSMNTDSPRVKATVGCHRSRTPEETLAWISPKLPHVGVTRVADITGLDHIGIPVWQAVRPAARTLAVSQGKGFTSALAKVSAVMEAVELWHAEQQPALTQRGTAREIASDLVCDPCEFPLAYGSLFHSGIPIEWVPATVAANAEARQTWVPAGLVHLDAVVRSHLHIPLFDASTNGLASGNTIEEARLHGLLELIERDSLVSTASVRQPIAPAAVTGYPSLLVDKFAAAGVHLRIEAVRNRFDLPCYEASIFSESFPEVFSGAGCHLDAHVALSRALTEAAQARLTAIAGTRDDLSPEVYRRTQSDPSALAQQVALAWATVPEDSAPFASSSEQATSELAYVIERVLAVTSVSPLFVDHTRDDLEVPVVHSIAPGLVR